MENLEIDVVRKTNKIAREACLKVFPYHDTVFCHAGEKWDNIKTLYE